MTKLITDHLDPRILPEITFESCQADLADMSISQLNALLMDSDQTKEPLRLTNVRFANLNLSRVDFRRVVFFNCEFIDCRLLLTQFSGCSIYSTRFEACEMLLAEFNHALLQCCVIERCNIENARFIEAIVLKTVLYRASGRSICLDHATFRDSRIHDCNMKQASVLDTVFKNMEFRETNRGDDRDIFDCANIKDALFESCKFNDTTFDSTHITSSTFDSCNFNGRGFINSVFNATKFLSCKSSSLHFNDSFLFECRFEDCKLYCINGSSSRLLDCTITNSCISGGFAYARLIGGYIDRSRIESEDRHFQECPPSYRPTVLEAKYLHAPVEKRVLVGPRVDIRGMCIGGHDASYLVDLKNIFDDGFASECKINCADMRHSSWRNADLSNTTLSKVDVSGADFSNANFTNTVFTRVHDQICLNHTGKFITSTSRDLDCVPVIYDAKTKWPEGFEITEIMVDEAELIDVKKKAAELGLSLPSKTADGLVFLPSPHELSGYTYLYAILPDLFEVHGRFAVATRSAVAAQDALVGFAESLRKSESGENLQFFQDKLDISMSVMSETMTASIVRAVMDSSGTYHDAYQKLLNMMSEHIKELRKANRKAAKRGAPASDPRVAGSLQFK